MGDDDDSRTIPSWQRRDSPDSAASSDPPDLEEVEPKPEPDSPPAEPAAESREQLVAQAASWLEHPQIRDAPHEGKVSFLEGKGLTPEEIRQMLDGAHTTAAEESTTTETTSSISSTEDSQPSSSSAPSAALSTSSHDETPPIITYPEFMLSPPAKPPLISRTAVLNTLSVAAAATGALHVTSTYLVGPLLAELAGARHDLYATTTSNLERLNAALTAAVSRVPAAALAAKPRRHATGSDSDSEDSDSDPSELFHRDIGVQTSRPASPDSAASNEQAGEARGAARADAHAASLGRLRSQLHGLVAAAGGAGEAQRGAADAVADVEKFLDTVRLGRRGPGKVGGIPGLADGVGYLGGVEATGGQAWDEGEDEIDRLKKEIRGVKGVLLSARTFPGVSR